MIRLTLFMTQYLLVHYTHSQVNISRASLRNIRHKYGNNGVFPGWNRNSVNSQSPGNPIKLSKHELR